MSKALAGLGPEAMQVLIAEDPKALFGITRELARVAELLNKKGDKLATTETPDEKPAMSAEDRAKAMKEIFGLPA
jgi:hypothetical protein